MAAEEFIGQFVGTLVVFSALLFRNLFEILYFLLQLDSPRFGLGRAFFCQGKLLLSNSEAIFQIVVAGRKGQKK